MFKIFTAVIFLIISLVSMAEESKLGLDYLQLTENPILAEIMLEIEPKLKEHYQKSKFGCVTGFVEDAIERVASNLRKDTPRKSLKKTLEKILPDIPLRFLDLDKEQYPNFWNYGELIRLKKRKEDALWLYKALHGKDFDQ